MPRYFIKLAYNGSNYHGWQSQQNAHSVQDELEHCLSLKLGHAIRLTGCGRTDTGVHARMFYVHFDADIAITENDIKPLLHRLNAFLPRDIVIYSLFEVPPEAHARFDAVERTYHYQITRRKDPFMLQQAFYLQGPLDVDKMQQCAEVLKQHTDFTSFSKLHTQTKTNNCRISRAIWSQHDDLLVFGITADRFLRNMVRALVGTLIEAGQGKLNVDDFNAVIQAKDRSAAGYSVPAHGLFLQEVVYPAHIVKNENRNCHSG